MSEIVVAARAILAIERGAAQARKLAGTSRQITGRSEALDLTAARWGKARRWLEWALKASDAAEAEPDRFGRVMGFLDRAGAPNVAWAWIEENRERAAGELTPLPAGGAAGPVLTPRWDRLSDVAVAARALLTGILDHGTPVPGVRYLDPARRRTQALNHVAALWGQRGDWLQKIFDLCEAAEENPERFGFLVDTMNRAGRPQAAWTRLGSLVDEARVGLLVPTDGRFHTLVMDVPWRVDEISEASDHGYAQMGFDEILGLKSLIDRWAADDFCHLWFWAKNNSTGLAHQALEHYGFDFKISHIWSKPMGRGRYARNSHETVLFAMRGDRKCKDAFRGTPTVHAWPRPDGPESSKPDGFYAMVQSLSHGPYGEAFQRMPRDGFVDLYRPAEPVLSEAAE
ncbi:MT-A70 family methyltransferase [Methylobacterium sp. J-030]|uniref:MT-A70 family methyltransferase n=1 Tax=Methylobacterium sp. J-030 TaxID=2836627 RepID=UPI001FBB7ACB|nr:MT-A70 family methyltransferase [Methylobacterium sp. J-030]MCJ2067798.1 MT-A70 family methyltransferase [Methylobacterium sp. J-030]